MKQSIAVDPKGPEMEIKPEIQEDKKGDLGKSRKYGMDMKAWRMEKISRSFIEQHVHSEGCQPYQNIGLICETIVRLTRKNDSQITIHDLLTFACTYCGHGRWNLKLDKGEERQVKQHVMWDCHQECCGKFLDRRYLQYEGGDCECGVLLMHMLGIIPALIQYLFSKDIDYQIQSLSYLAIA